MAADEASVMTVPAGLSVYTVCNARYFPALVLLVASVERHAPGTPLTVYDVGLDDVQRVWLRTRATIVDGTAARRAVPSLDKAFAATLDPSGPILIIDADGLVAGDLGPLVEKARAGSIVAAVDPMATRRVAAWSDRFGLQAPLRVQRYVGAGTVLLDADVHGGLLRRWWDLCGVASDRYAEWRADPDEPLMHNDQDVLNALLMSEVPEGAVEHFTTEQMAASLFMPGVRLHDRRRLVFSGPGGGPLVVQCMTQAKPFLPEGGASLFGSAYTMALRAVLVDEARRSDPGGAVDPSVLVPWLRPGPLGAIRFRWRTVWIRTRKALGRWRARYLPHR
ncbi:MAG: hypothetical protein FJW77_06680 [Actinobacteria bacterium]|nr:hypothetical protein [Actinomycetota bacterium]